MTPSQDTPADSAVTSTVRTKQAPPTPSVRSISSEVANVVFASFKSTLERNMGNRITEDLITGVLTTSLVHVRQQVQFADAEE